ncbi:MAG TPA: LacI family DNA-binding transcriptional regulator [Rhodothermales bacterium]|nr:LacI family DNA-binding transcriptional regulator [Rhodothermales bacterium]
MAQHAGVSTATVSAVVNDATWVSDETRARVKDAARTLGYRPNRLARSLKTRETGTVGVIVSDLTNPYFTEVVRALGRALRADDRTLLLGDAEQSYDLGTKHYETLPEKRVDGLVLIGASVPAEVVSAHAQEAPVVAIERNYATEGVTCLLVDSEQGGYDATSHLIALGRRRIAAITGPSVGPGQSTYGRAARHEGYRRALVEAGRGYDPALVVEGDFQFEGGRAAMRRLLDLPEQPDAVFASNDLMALGAMLEARLSSLRVPDDVAVVGYDDVPMAALVTPSLTTLAMPKEALGREAAAVLERRLRGVDGVSVPRQMFSATLVVRESSGAGAALA